MALKKMGFIVTGSDLEPQKHSMLMFSESFELVTVGISDASEGPDVARSLMSEGVELIELCGAFGPHWTAKVIEAIEGEIPVGTVSYGLESIPQVQKLLS